VRIVLFLVHDGMFLPNAFLEQFLDEQGASHHDGQQGHGVHHAHLRTDRFVAQIHVTLRITSEHA
jgi:hypothetical protein